MSLFCQHGKAARVRGARLGRPLPRLRAAVAGHGGLGRGRLPGQRLADGRGGGRGEQRVDAEQQQERHRESLLRRRRAVRHLGGRERSHPSLRPAGGQARPLAERPPRQHLLAALPPLRRVPGLRLGRHDHEGLGREEQTLHPDLLGALQGGHLRPLLPRREVGRLLVEGRAAAPLGPGGRQAPAVPADPALPRHLLRVLSGRVYRGGGARQQDSSALGSGELRVHRDHPRRGGGHPSDALLPAIQENLLRLRELAANLDLGPPSTEVAAAVDSTVLTCSRSSVEVSWDRVSDLSFCADDASVMVGSYISNFASIWRVSCDSSSEPRAKASSQSPSIRRRDEGRGGARSEEEAVPRRGDGGNGGSRGELNLKSRGESKEDSEPKVNWESGASRRDLSASMGESFMRKVREQQLEQVQRAGRPSSNKIAEEDAASALEDERLSMEALKGLLPSPGKSSSSRYDDDDDLPIQAPPARHQSSLGELNPSFRVNNGDEVLVKHSKSPQDFLDDAGGMNVVGNRLSGQSSEESRAKKDIVVTDVLVAGTRLLPQLTQRIGLVRILRKFWERGEVADIVAQLVTMREGARHDRVQMLALGDFFGVTSLNSLTLTLDVCVDLLPILEEMVSDGTEYVVFAAFKGIVTLLEAFGDLIRQTRSTISVGGVDISREERLKKCSSCHDVLIRIKSSLPVLRNKIRLNKPLVALMDSVKQSVND